MARYNLGYNAVNQPTRRRTMDKRVLGIISAIFLGGTFGLFVANGIMPVDFWWVGVLVGGAIAYFTYDFQTVKKAAKAVWLTSKDEYIKLLKVLGGIIGAILVCIFAFILPFAGWSFFSNYMSGENSLIINLFLSAIFSICWLGATIMLSEFFNDSTWIEWDSSEGLGIISFIVWIAVGYLMIFGFSPWSNPANQTIVQSILLWLALIVIFSVVLILACVIINWSWKLVGLCYRLIFITSKFLFMLTKAIYSDERLLCMQSAVVGVGVGRLITHDPALCILGGIIGAVFGVAQYEILSKRVFKLVPIEIK